MAKAHHDWIFIWDNVRLCGFPSKAPWQCSDLDVRLDWLSDTFAGEVSSRANLNRQKSTEIDRKT